MTDGRLEIAHEQQCFGLNGGEDEMKSGVEGTTVEKWGGLKVEWAHERLRYNSRECFAPFLFLARFSFLFLLFFFFLLIPCIFWSRYLTLSVVACRNLGTFS